MSPLWDVGLLAGLALVAVSVGLSMGRREWASRTVFAAGAALVLVASVWGV